MDRRTLVGTLKSDIEGRWKHKKQLLRRVLTEMSFEEIGGTKLTEDELAHIFDGVDIYGKAYKIHRDEEVKWIACCETCGRYAGMRWWYETPPNIEDLWREFTNGKQLYSVKDSIIECLANLHKVVVKSHSELQKIKEFGYLKRAEQIEKEINAQAENLIKEIFKVE